MFGVDADGVTAVQEGTTQNELSVPESLMIPGSAKREL